MKEYAGKRAIQILSTFVQNELDKKSGSEHTHAVATQTTNGFLSSTDKKKLDGVATGANKYVHPSYDSHEEGLYKISSDSSGHVSGVKPVTKDDITNLGIPAQDTVYTHPTSAGNKHIPSGGKSGDILRWASNGTAAWGDDIDTTYTPASEAPLANGTASAGTSEKYAREDHVHPLQTTVSGNAGTATKLKTARTIHVDLGNTDAASFNGSANVTPGVTGVLAVANGGTGNNTGNAPTATKATQDSAGQQINTTYIKSLSVSGKTVTFTRGDNTTGTITTQDTTYTAASAAPLAAGTAAVGTSAKYAREDHVHPIQTTVSGNAGSATKLATARTIAGVSFNGTGNIAYYGTCSTAAATVAKVVDLTGFTLVSGAEVTVKFTVTNSAANPTLNVNSTGAKAIYYRGAAITKGYLAANRTYKFVYNGTEYELIGDLDTNTTYSVATQSANGLMSSTDKTKLDGIATGATANAASTTTPKAAGTAAVGTEAGFARGDHVHPLQTTVSGNAGSATKLATARTINGTSFDGSANITTANWGTARTIGIAGDATGSASINGSANANISITRRGCMVGQTGNTTANPWFKFASLQVPTTNYDGHIIFNVYQNFADTSTKMGVLKAHIRTQTNNYWQQSELVWEYVSSSIAAADFVMVHTANNVAPCIAELWCKCATAYAGYQFDVISEGSRFVRSSQWTLYNTPDGAAAVTAGRVNQNSTVMTLQNPTTANAATATKATQDSAGQQINTTYIKALSVSGKTITYTKGDGTTGTITTQDTNTTYSAMTGASASAAGTAGLVPAPAAGKQTSFLRGDGTWVVPTNTTYSNMTAATASAAGKAGLVPAPAAGAQAKYLRGDGTWQTPPDTNTTYSAATTSAAGLMSAADKTKLDGIATGANNYTYTLPAATSSVRGGVKIGYTANGKNYPVQLSNEQMYVNVPWTDNNTTYSAMTGASASAAGTAGLVPAPAAGTQAKYLRGDGTWQTPPDTNTTYSAMTGASASADGAAGLVPKPTKGNQAKYLRADGTWQTPPNTTYSAMTAASASAAGTSGLVPAPAAGKQASFLRGDGTWVVPTNTTYSAATTSANGLMSSTDKAKLDLITKPATTGYVIQKDSTGYYIEV